MIQSIGIYEGHGFDPHYNIATEKFLLDHIQEGQCILYLWQNKNTVVIGRNQNAWAECRTSLLAQEGGVLARRLSGGGAVFHDLGNLNFTFLVRDEDYDLDRQFDVILTACRSLGISAEKSGRNDLLADGCKFSGNAFYHSQGHAYHHGTLLVDADMDKLARYLTPPRAKLEAKGVRSVRSRVTNLKQLCPSLTVDLLKTHLKQAFAQVYHCTPTPVVLSDGDLQQIAKSAEELGSWQWCYGPKLPFSFSCEAHFPWGNIQLQLQVENGCIRCADAFTDAMDWTISDRIVRALTACRFSPAEMQAALTTSLKDATVAADICSMLAQQF